MTARLFAGPGANLPWLVDWEVPGVVDAALPTAAEPLGTAPVANWPVGWTVELRLSWLVAGVCGLVGLLARVLGGLPAAAAAAAGLAAAGSVLLDGVEGLEEGDWSSCRGGG